MINNPGGFICHLVADGRTGGENSAMTSKLSPLASLTAFRFADCRKNLVIWGYFEAINHKKLRAYSHIFPISPFSPRGEQKQDMILVERHEDKSFRRDTKAEREGRVSMRHKRKRGEGEGKKSISCRRRRRGKEREKRRYRRQQQPPSYSFYAPRLASVMR